MDSIQVEVVMMDMMEYDYIIGIGIRLNIPVYFVKSTLYTSTYLIDGILMWGDHHNIRSWATNNNLGNPLEWTDSDVLLFKISFLLPIEEWRIENNFPLQPSDWTTEQWTQFKLTWL
jgi:hypothetical protein